MNCEISYTDMCRACMKVDGLLIPMYDNETMKIKNLPDKLAELTSIQIDEHDGLPNVLCAKCAYRTDAFYDFKLQVQATEKKLRRMFSTNVNVLKLEGMDDEDNDAYVPEVTKEQGEETDAINITTDVEETCSIIHIGDTEETTPINGMDGTEVDEPEEIHETNLETSNLLVQNVQELESIQNERLIMNGVDSGIAEELSKILHSSEYTIMYIPDGTVDKEGTIETNSSTVCRKEDVDDTFLETQRTEILNDSQNNAITYKVNTNYPSMSKKEANEIIVNESLLPENMQEDDSTYPNLSSNTTFNDSDEEQKNCDGNSSDSDYFIDPQDNILGSLNDTITRIKEIKVDGTKTQYQCTLCLQNYDALTGVLLHTIDNHVPSSGPFYCVVCEKDCESRRDLISHVKTHRGQFPYSCFICHKAYATKRYLKRHMVCHTDFPRYRCAKCGERFKIKSELETHVQTHLHGAPYACSQCPRVFNHKGNYKRHLITHLDPQGLHLPKYPCQVCGKRFLNNRTLETHMRVHTGEKPFKCEVCGRSFSQQGNLLNHARIHSNPRSYTCEVCGKRFNQRATLRDHSLLHTGEKPYVCNVCGIAFTFSAALRRHMWTHAGGKPFGCEICDARFVGKYDLRRHMRVHSDRPRGKRKKNTIKQKVDITTTVEHEDITTRDETVNIDEEPEIVLIEQVLLSRDVTTEVIRQEESEKENVDALFSLIQYG